MTTYYGVWSGKEWWLVLGEVFHTTALGVAKAQAASANTAWNKAGCDKHWAVRAIGEDGLPVEESESSPSTDLLLDAQQKLLDLPGVEGAYIEVMLGIDRVTRGDLSSCEFEKYDHGVKTIANSIRAALRTDRADAVRITNWVHNHIREDGTIIYGWTRIEDLPGRRGP